MPKLFPFTSAWGAAAIFVAVSTFWASPQRLLADDKPQQDEAASPNLAEKLIGTWVLEEAKTPGTPSGIGSRLKFFTGTHWMITQPDPNTGVVVFHHGGGYTLDDDTLKTTTDFAAASTKSRIGTKGSFKIQVDGDTYKQADAKGIFNETWKRAKSAEATKK